MTRVDYYLVFPFMGLAFLFIILFIRKSRIVFKLKRLLKEAHNLIKKALLVAAELANLNDTLINQLNEDEEIISKLTKDTSCDKSCCKKQKAKK